MRNLLPGSELVVSLKIFFSFCEKYLHNYF